MDVSGNGFGLAGAQPLLPFTIAAGAEIPVDLVCTGSTSGVQAGALTLNGRWFSLVATVAGPSYPDAWLELDVSASRSARQSSVRVRLASAVAEAADGVLRLEFLPAVGVGTSDEAIQFVGVGGREANVRVEAGSASSGEIVFQTGTTAGTLSFRLLLGRQIRELRVVIPAEAPRLEEVELVRGEVGSVDVLVSGFDNHRSAGNVVFAFVDTQGRELPVASVEAGKAFSDFFREDVGLGGLFRLRARFPVVGDASQLAGVRVKVANVLGVGVGSSNPSR